VPAAADGPDPVADPVRLARVIGRLNVGGPAIQALTLTRELAPRGFETLLLSGTESAHEGSMDQLAASLGVRAARFGASGRELAAGDLVALARLVRVLRGFRPAIVHTHAAKGGALGRMAATVLRPRPVVVHTFHGHSLRGYFGPGRQRAFLEVERALAGTSDLLVAVSDEVRDELVALGVAPASKFQVVPLGFDLSPFVADERQAAAAAGLRRTLVGEADDAVIVTLIARLVPIKRVDRFLRIAARVRDPRVRFVVVGDGLLREDLLAQVPPGLSPRLRWLGFRDDIAAVCHASDAVVLTSDNEGTPVSLIEAMACARPVIATRVGGTPSVVGSGATGFLVEPDDEAGFAACIDQLAGDAGLRRGLGVEGRRRVRRRHQISRLVDDLDRAYRALLTGRPATGSGAGSVRPPARPDGWRRAAPTAG